VTYILGLSGRKQSGKNSIADFLIRNASEIFKYDNYEASAYAFADELKEFCIKSLGLKPELCYGTDTDKNSLTHILFENLPYVQKGNVSEYMTVREVLQHVGSNIFRKLDNDIWTRACLSTIEDDEPDLAIITDVRFPNEVKAIQNVGGRVLRLIRNPFPDDSHISETALDKENFDWLGFDAILDNSQSTIMETNKEVVKLLRMWGWA
jgi:hypothetical protein